MGLFVLGGFGIVHDTTTQVFTVKQTYKGQLMTHFANLFRSFGHSRMYVIYICLQGH